MMSSKLEETLAIIKKVNRQFKNPVIITYTYEFTTLLSKYKAGIYLNFLRLIKCFSTIIVYDETNIKCQCEIVSSV